jgi:predicted alpha/beta superfamily hydrolase
MLSFQTNALSTIRNLLPLFVLCLLIHVSIHGQSQQAASVIHDILKINSQILGEERTILVRVPAAYQKPDTRFPVVYMLDAHPPQNAMMAGIVEQQAWGDQMPEMIIVGIQNTSRTRDLTPTRTERLGGGGGDKFLDFIEKEVIPLIERNYRTQPFRVFAGHSYGGLAVVYSFVSRPELFNAYIAASPYLHWDNDLVIKRAQEVLKQKRDWRKKLFVGVGNEPEYLPAFRSLKEVLQTSNPKNLEFEFQQYQNDNHASALLPVYFAGLRKIFAGWPPPESGNVGDLEGHYRKLSDRFGYRILVPENLLNQAGYQLIGLNRLTEAIDVFKRNVENYPNSANCYDSLAEALEKSGKIKESRTNYEKAYKMATANGEAQLAISAKANFDRISKKIE